MEETMEQPVYTDKIPKMADQFKEGDQRWVNSSTWYDPSNFYLVLASQWPERVDRFTRTMTKDYKEKKKNGGDDWRISKKSLFPGLHVAAYNRQDREWQRARIFGEVGRTKSNGQLRGPYFVEMVDIGGYQRGTRLEEIMPLSSKYLEQPVFSVKCRLYMNDFCCAYPFHSGMTPWPSAFSDHLRGCIFNQVMQAKFLRQVMDTKGELVWEVSLEKYQQQPWQYDEEDNNNKNFSVEKQAVLSARRLGIWTLD